MSSITYTRELEPGTEGSIAITAAEGGIGYWSRIDSYDWARWCHYGEPVEQPDDFVFYVIRADEDDDGSYSGPPIAVTPTLIRRGMELFLRGVTDPPPGASTFEGRAFDDMEDLAAMDAAEADCVIQLGAYGGLVYG